jgi:hypothetical protein
MHPVEALWARHAPPAGYPPGVVPVPDPIPGLAFFPGGYGLWGCAAGKPLPPLTVGGVMVLGHDFHSEDGYRKSYQMGAEPETLPTWRNLLRLLREVGIPPEQSFFTNLYMGLRAGSATTGVFPGAHDVTFVAHCERFLLDQLRVQRPALVLTLGIHVPPVIGRLSPELKPWTARRGLRHLDAVGPVQEKVTFPGLTGWTTTVVALTHPSLRGASVRHRRYQGAEKHDAEVRMLHDARARAGLAAT